MNRYLYFIILLFFCSDFALSQNEQHKVCGTTQFLKSIYEKHPEKRQVAEQLELFTQQYIVNSGIQRIADTTFVIPVVVHVLHEYGDENITYEAIDDGILRINQDFSAQNEDIGDVVAEFTDLVADIGIEFRLATIDPDGHCTYGVNRIATHLTNVVSSRGDNVENAQNLIAWDDKKYLNIWVVKEFLQDPNSYGDVLAFANYPGTGVVVDGIFCRHNYFGTQIGQNNNNGLHTLGHEMGHFFNLKHTWGSGSLTDDDGDPLEENCLDDDGVDDTPNTRGSFACLTTLEDQEDLACEEGVLENCQNIMNYANCTNMFTHGQAVRMRAAAESFAGNRQYLWQVDNLEATGTDDAHLDNSPHASCKPTPDFKTDDDLGCIGATIAFEDFTYNFRDESISYNWIFEGGSPSSSSDEDPTVQYNESGTYDVTLIACNGHNNCDTLTRENYITILSQKTIEPEAGVTELQGFESETFPNIIEDDETWWIGEDYDEEHWERTELASTEGASSFRIKSQNHGPNRNSHSFSTPTLDLSGFESSNEDKLMLCFDYAYARRLPYNEFTGDDEPYSIHNDVLIVSYQDGCSGGFLERPRLSTRPGVDGLHLSRQESLFTTDSVYFNHFVPESHQWSQTCIDMQGAAEEDEVVIQFEFIGGGTGEDTYLAADDGGGLLQIPDGLISSTIGGNWLYIDNITIGNESDFNNNDEIPRNSMIDNLILSPNPAQSNNISFSVDLYHDTEVQILLTSFLGRFIGAKTINLDRGNHEFLLTDLFNIPNKGSYILDLKTSTSRVSDILIIR